MALSAGTRPGPYEILEPLPAAPGGDRALGGREDVDRLTEPTRESVAAALDRLAGDRALAERLGGQAQRDAAAHTWDDAVRELLR